MTRRSRVLGALLSLGLVVAACGGDDDASTTTAAGGTETTAASGGSAGGAITIALGSEPTSLDPHLVDDGGERAINDNVYETLLARTPDGEIVPGLAAELPTQIDDTTWEFKLREGVTFHDGTAFTADAVVASVERMKGFIEAGSTDNDGFFAVLTGAGMSAESGVPTFRDAQTGLWAKFRPEELATESAFRANPTRV